MVLLKLLVITQLTTHYPCQETKRTKFSTINRPPKEHRPFYPDYWFSIVEPDMNKHHTAHYGDYRYFDPNYEYTVNMDFYRYGATEVPDYNQDPAHISHFSNTKSMMHRYWKHYKFYYKLSFDGKEDKLHYLTFRANLLLMGELSKQHLDAHFRINAFTHMPLDTFLRIYAGYDNTTVDEDLDDYDAEPIEFSTELSTFPRQLDWSVFKGRSTPPPISQEKCNFSWVFSAVHNMELRLLLDPEMNIRADNMLQLSYQQAYDCADPQKKCDTLGGKPHYVFRGLMGEEGVYIRSPDIGNPIDPYKYSCRFHEESLNLATNTSSEPVAHVWDYGLLIVDDEFDLMLALNEYGPLCTAIHASEALKNYHSGILSEKGCDGEPNHAVLLVGYAQRGKTPYWIIKNSWGPKWGQGGFFFLIRDKKACGIGEYLSYVNLKAFPTTTTTTTRPTRRTTTTECDPKIRLCGNMTENVYYGS